MTDTEAQRGETWLTVRDVAARLRVSEWTVRRWLRGRELRGRNLGGRGGYRVRASEVARFMEADTRGTAA